MVAVRDDEREDSTGARVYSRSAAGSGYRLIVKGSVVPEARVIGGEGVGAGLPEGLAAPRPAQSPWAVPDGGSGR